ncbi:hypothetical protein GQ600_19267 [Phytophthora cactorum]|nr:hypothetical protein GQ600_19267 [Phytophthora cactorum]
MRSRFFDIVLSEEGPDPKVKQQAAWEKKQLKKKRHTDGRHRKCEPLPFPTQEQIDLLLSDQQKLIRESYTPLTASDWMNF